MSDETRSRPGTALGTDPVASASLGRLVSLLVVVLPFALFWWQLPYVGARTIGNDYTLFPTRWQQELLFSVRMGSFPLFVPGFAGGHTASALSLGQLHHPQSWLAALLPGYWSGYALDANTLLRLLSLGLAHLVLARTFRMLRLGTALAVLIAGVAVYNLRMLDWFRFGASLESYTGFLFGATAALRLWMRPGERRWSWLLVAATYGTVTGGHPQVMYYGLLGIGLVVLLAPWYADLLLGEAGRDPGPRGPRVLRHHLRCGLCILGGLSASAAYVLPYMEEFLGGNTERMGRDYAWADDFRDSLAGTLDNFVLPLVSSVGGAFGGSALLLAAALVPLALLVRRRAPLSILALWGFGLFAFLHMQGGRLGVHRWVWSTLPLADSFRIAGRISTLLPLTCAFLCAWVLGPAFAEERDVTDRAVGAQPSPGGRARRARAVWIASAFVVTVVVLFLPEAWTRDPAKWSPVLFREIPSAAHALTGAFAAGTLACLGIAVRRPEGDGRLAVWLAGLCAAGELLVCFTYGTWVEERRPTPSFAELSAEKRERLDYTGDPGHGLYSWPILELIQQGGTVEPFLAKAYGRTQRVRDAAEMYLVTRDGARDPSTLFVADPSAPRRPSPPGGPRSVRLTYASFNRLTFATRSPDPTHVGLGLPESPLWTATVDGEAKALHPANGAYMAVAVPAGDHVLELRYESPASRRGWLVSCTTLALLLGVASWTARGRAARIAFLVAALGLPPVLYRTWSASLYDGTPLGTVQEHTWHPDTARRPNLAFGARAWTSSLRGPQWKHKLGGSAAVDGDVGPGTGTLTRTEANPSWTVHLGSDRPIAEILVHEGGTALAGVSRRDTEDPYNECPLFLEVSPDNQRWTRIATIEDPAAPNDPSPLRLRFPTPIRGRFLRILGRDTRLALNEVEVFAPMPE